MRVYCLAAALIISWMLAFSDRVWVAILMLGLYGFCACMIGRELGANNEYPD